MANKANSLSYTKRVCKYYIVFTPKHRRKIIYNQYKISIRDILVIYKNKIICVNNYCTLINFILLCKPYELAIANSWNISLHIQSNILLFRGGKMKGTGKKGVVY